MDLTAYRTDLAETLGALPAWPDQIKAPLVVVSNSATWLTGSPDEYRTYELALDVTVLGGFGQNGIADLESRVADLLQTVQGLDVGISGVDFRVMNIEGNEYLAGVIRLTQSITDTE